MFTKLCGVEHRTRDGQVHVQLTNNRCEAKLLCKETGNVLAADDVQFSTSSPSLVFITAKYSTFNWFSPNSVQQGQFPSARLFRFFIFGVVLVLGCVDN